MKVENIEFDFFPQELDANDPQCFYHLDDTDFDSINKYLSSLVEKALYELECSYCLEIDEDQRGIKPMTLGRISSYYYLNHCTVRMFRDELKSESTIAELIEILSNAQEYAQLPVRHNEDQINSELATKVPLEVNPHSYDSSHTKTYLLLQCHFGQLPLPSTDYNTDTKSVLDQAIRILQAMLDVSADEGWLVTALRITQLVQMVVQGRWCHDNSLLTLPQITPYHLSCLRPQRSEGARRKGFPDLPGPITSLPEFMAVCDGKFDALMAMLGEEMNRTHLDQLYQVICRLPQIQLSVTVKGWWEEGGGQQESKEINLSSKGGVRPESDWIPVHADQEYVVEVNLQRINKSRKSDSKAFTPRFPKPKDEGWFLIIGDIESREVIALKRVSYVRHTSKQQLAIYTPENTGRVIYTIYLMSDSYIGLDQQYDICFDVIPASIESQVNTELINELGDLDFDEE
ncbi:hypothetical protein FSP39_011463 [Pinctada imbricata]|uniref:SEC63 domain-containing protein n=1 Tax=Pinctada imbricata TaxID=66713 RepID=A0AA89C752_PINIB|nr:hypothetical protein FSP39_011463 [Pinctada imbricata]